MGSGIISLFAANQRYIKTQADVDNPSPYQSAVTYYLDCVFKETHDSKLTITEHPVETGGKISDHAYLNPRILTIEAGVSDNISIFRRFNDKFSGGESRSKQAFSILSTLQENRILLTIGTGFKLYENMLLEALSVPQDKKNPDTCRFTATFKQIPFASVKFVQIPSERRTAGKTRNKNSALSSQGNVQGVSTNRSFILNAWNTIKGAE